MPNLRHSVGEPRRVPLASRQAAKGTMRRHRPDYWLVVLTVLLLAIGLVVVYSIGPALSATRGEGSGTNYVARQLIAILLSAVAFLVTSRVPLRVWRQWQWLLLGLALLGTIVALLTPVIPNYPAHRWIRFGPLSLQSVEALKFALLITVSGFFALQAKRDELKDARKTLYPLLAVLLIIGILVGGIQSDFGSMGVIMVMFAVMAYVVGLPMRRLALVALIAIVGGVLLISSTPYRRARLHTYLNPESSCQTTGYQACQALIAVGSGGMFGLGVGKGAQAYGYLPEAQNDSIFAIFAEKFGFVGSALLIGLFVTLFARLRLIAERAPTMFSRLVVVGVLAWLTTQTIINIGAMIGLLPLKGITLPLISYGGTSVLFVGAALGLVFQVSHYTSFTSRQTPAKGRGDNENSHDRGRIGRSYYADLGRRP